MIGSYIENQNYRSISDKKYKDDLFVMGQELVLSNVTGGSFIELHMEFADKHFSIENFKAIFEFEYKY